MRAVLLAAVLAACGDDPDETCKPEGFADGETIVMGEPLGPFPRAALSRPEDPRNGVAFALTFDEGDGACGEPGPGRRITILFCSTPAKMDYEVASRLTFRCPSDTVLVLLEDENGDDLAESTDGHVEVSYAGGCVSGSYEVQLDTGVISGSFDAVVCPDDP